MLRHEEAPPQLRPVVGRSLAYLRMDHASPAGGQMRAPPFCEEAFRRAKPEVRAIRARLPSFSSPPLRVQRVGQLDAHLLDEELTNLLAEPVKSALRKVSPSLEKQCSAELYLLLRLVLYKFSIVDRGATYGAMLQNLRYRNEWAHKQRAYDIKRS